MKVRIPSTIRGRPLAVGLARRELAGIPFVVKALDEAINPPEAQRLLDRVVITDRRSMGVSFVEDEPDFRLRVVVIREPGPPLFACPRGKRL